MVKLIELLNKLEAEYGEYIYHKKPFPKPYYENLDQVKVILLGSNPIAVGEFAELNYVFNLDSYKRGQGDIRIFNNIYENLTSIDLELWDIYAQNLCRNYLINISVHDDKWVEIAKLWAEILRDELNDLFPKDIPILITAPWILKPLIDNVDNEENYYSNNQIIKAENNKLGRVLIPFFRQKEFSLKNNQWIEYKQFIKGLVHNK